MKKFLMLIVLSYALVACENGLESVNEQYKTRVALEDEKKKADVNFRIFKDRTQSGKKIVAL
jgi:uncharacterized protein YcfL